MLSAFRILVTGGAGFIGSHLVDALLAQGAELVRVLDDLSNGSRANLSEHLNNPRFELIGGSITDPTACERACAQMTHVTHQAALGSVPRSLREPERFMMVNVVGFSNLLEAARQAGVRRVVYASSSSVYGDNETLPKQETRTGRALSPYALTKQINEQQADLWGRLYGLETVGLRYFNVFGHRQRPDGPYASLIPRLLQAARQTEAPVFFGDGHQSRDFTHIDNVVRANLLALTTTNPDALGQVFNVATGRQISLNDAWAVIRKQVGYSLFPTYAAARPGDIRHSLADITKARLLLGYEPTVDFESGIRLSTGH
ncbi:NAD-dependent epimerase/dehydratase family protein [Rudanella paleaurantiibacter]|uniref:NAD-dependent epimerase/dehydratase family protein n=1 Tax=Rudanella paleaurantiibacter TaxID=2614655 RepID=A0A7J5U5I6_9BACT|nr:SDR family oxidoreductase [Rudanella paleaurantiibacter]KAB7732943.1 NAD-dependent epimerase/dehydratase family protein [Rudanella paleaurantiibacter]